MAGGMAVNLYGFIRATMDLDLLMMLDDANTGKFIKIANELGYQPAVSEPLEDLADPVKREEWIHKKNMKVFSVYNPANGIDRKSVV